MLHLMHDVKVNGAGVPEMFKLPEYSDNLAGYRLLLLEELDLC